MNQLNRIAVVYGSGATFDSGYLADSNFDGDKHLPTDKEFFASPLVHQKMKQLDDLLMKFITCYFGIRTAGDLSPLELGLEDVWSVIDLMRIHSRLDTFGESELTQEKKLGVCERALLKLVWAVYGSPTLADSNADRYWNLHKALTVDRRASVHYITFNYDTCLEQALRKNEESFRYVSDVDTVDCWLGHTRVPVILKLHGSLNWKHRIPEPMGEKPSTIEIEPTSLPWNSHSANFLAVEPQFGGGGCGQYPAIIPPTWFKHEINDYRRGENRLTRLILHQWKSACKTLEKAQAIIVVGYSFPRTDILSQQLFRLATHQRGEGNAMRLLYCTGDVDETCHKGYPAPESIFGHCFREGILKLGEQ